VCVREVLLCVVTVVPVVKDWCFFTESVYIGERFLD
jgi:hypothetical protein